MPDPLETVLAYHAATKHQPQRYANGPGYLDWDNQPDPFRRFDGAVSVLLPFVPSLGHPGLDELCSDVPAAPLALETVSQLFERSLAISAWKEFRDKRWALRCNPSSGNLHPTEGYALLPALAGLSDEPGVFHYRSVDHALERRCAMEPAGWQAVARGLPEGAFALGLSSVVWREAWKYGERAFRYCQHDVGHALAALRYAAATLGWTVWLASTASDDDVRGLLGLDRSGDFEGAETEHPDLLAIVSPTGSDRSVLARWPGNDAVAAVRRGAWHGRANRLSAETVRWDAIDAVTPAVEKSARSVYEPPAAGRTWSRFGPDAQDAIALIRQRRSALDFDGETTLSSERFFRMLDRTMPRRDGPPMDVFDGTPAVHLAIFVHRVDGLEPGLYLLVRDVAALDALRASFDPEHDWTHVASAPADLPLYQLALGDARRVAQSISCTQAIAGDGVFSLGMIAECEPQLRAHGPWFYRRLFWETGAVGQVLYLEAEAAGIRATGIGCFFDDMMHRLLHLQDSRFQSLYHLAMGGPVEDARITTLAPYVRAGG